MATSTGRTPHGDAVDEWNRRLGRFHENAYISIFARPSVEKNGKISTIVPLVTHVDHCEHSVQVVVTEWGVADLRGKDEKERAQLIINHCSHPDYCGELQTYIDPIRAAL